MFGPPCLNVESDAYLELEGGENKKVYSSTSSHKGKGWESLDEVVGGITGKVLAAEYESWRSKKSRNLIFDNYEIELKSTLTPLSIIVVV